MMCDSESCVWISVNSLGSSENYDADREGL